MKKKLIAVAVAGALGAPALALAQASTLQIYGRAVVEYGYANQGNGKPNTDIMQGPGGASLGFKGEEKLGSGLSAWYQCESSADIRGDTAAGFCTRNSALGFKGGFGSVYFGKWDTPFKRVMLRTVGEGFSTGLLGSTRILTGFSTGTTAGGAPSRTLWQRRQHDVIYYNTPVMSGFQGLFMYSAANATATTNASTSAKPRIWSVAALYDNGPLALGLGYEKHLEFGSVGGTSQDDYAWALAGSYTFPGKVKVGGSYNKQNYDLGAGLSSSKNSWDLGVDWTISGPHGLRANYAKTDDISGNGGLIAGTTVISSVPAAGANTGARHWSIAYTHRFSKRTDGRLGYVRLENDANASYTLGGLNNTGLTAAQANGKKQDAWVTYLRHAF